MGADMDRVAQLAEYAESLLRDEKVFDELDADENRAITRECLAEVARDLGFPELEISAAIDTALKGR